MAKHFLAFLAVQTVLTQAILCFPLCGPPSCGLPAYNNLGCGTLPSLLAPLPAALPLQISTALPLPASCLPAPPLTCPAPAPLPVCPVPVPIPVCPAPAPLPVCSAPALPCGLGFPKFSLLGSKLALLKLGALAPAACGCGL